MAVPVSERGLLIGTALQVPLLLTGLMHSVMGFVAGAFVLIWLYRLQVRRELIGSPCGPVPVPVPGADAGGRASTPAVD